MAERVIRITGKGRVSVNPDRVQIIIGFSETFPQYEPAVADSTRKRKQLAEAFCELGFSNTDIKTLCFNVETVYENYQDKDHNWKKRFDGYRYEHRLKLEFKRDNERLGKVLYALVNSEGSPEITINYTVSDPNAVNNELMQKAVADARNNAEVLAGAAGVTLGEIQSIDYSWGELRLTTSRLGEMDLSDYKLKASRAYNVDIEPEDIDVEETVTVVWGIR